MSVLRSDKIDKGIYKVLLSRCQDGNKEVKDLLLETLGNCDDLSYGEYLAEKIAILNNYLSHYSHEYAIRGNCSTNSSVIKDVESTVNLVGKDIFKELRGMEKKSGLDNYTGNYDLWLYYTANVGYLLRTLLELNVISDSQYLVLYNTHSRQMSVEVCCNNAGIPIEDYYRVYCGGIESMVEFRL